MFKKVLKKTAYALVPMPVIGPTIQKLILIRRERIQRGNNKFLSQHSCNTPFNGNAEEFSLLTKKYQLVITTIDGMYSCLQRYETRIRELERIVEAQKEGKRNV